MKRKFKIPIYNTNVIVSDENDKSDVYDAYVDLVDNEIWLRYSKDKINDGIIVHEAVHIINFLYYRIGAKLDIYEDEHQAYLTQFIFNKLKQIIK